VKDKLIRWLKLKGKLRSQLILYIVIVLIAFLVTYFVGLHIIRSDRQLDYTPVQVPNNITGVSPVKININDYLKGEVAESQISIHNGNNATTKFSVKYRVPDFVADGFAKPPPEARDWVKIDDALPAIGAYEAKIIPIKLIIPSNSTVPDKKWEFWIGVIDQSQEGMIQAEMCKRQDTSRDVYSCFRHNEAMK